MKSKINTWQPFVAVLALCIFISDFLSAQSRPAYQDEYAGLLARMVEKGVDSPTKGDFLGPVAYWQDLWDRCKQSDTWTQLMNNAQLISKSIKESDGSTGTTRALLSVSDHVAWIAFPGVSTDANLQSGKDGKFITWPGRGNTDSQKDVHEYYYAEWKALQGEVTAWLSKQTFDKLIVTGHSKGGVLSQYFLADYADQLADKVIHFTAFGTPNAGSKAFVQTWAAASNLKRIKCYTTRGSFVNIGSPGGIIGSLFGADNSEEVDDLITWQEAQASVSLPGVIMSIDVGETYYPRGLSRSVGNYLTDYSSKITRQILTVSSDEGISKEEYAVKIHDDSYYLSGLQDNAIDPILPTALTSPMIQFAANQQKCLQNVNGTISDGNNIQLGNCQDNEATLGWLFLYNKYKLSVASQKCLDIKGGYTSNGTNIQLWECNTGSNQQWIYDGVFGTIRTYAGFRKCLSLEGSSSDPRIGTNIHLWDCKDNNVRQQWQIAGATKVENPSGVKTIRPLAQTGLCLDIEGAQNQAGANVQLWTCNDPNAEWEEWTFDLDGQIHLNAHADKCLGVYQSSNVHIWNCQGDNFGQVWIYDGLTQAFRWGKDKSKCLQVDLGNGSYEKRDNIKIASCDGGMDQQFEIQ